MNIQFRTYCKPVVVMPKLEAEAMLRNALKNDDRVDLILMNVMAHRPMNVHIRGVDVIISLVES